MASRDGPAECELAYDCIDTKDDLEAILEVYLDAFSGNAFTTIFLLDRGMSITKQRGRHFWVFAIEYPACRSAKSILLETTMVRVVMLDCGTKN